MKYSILFMTASCLVLLGACVSDDLSWKQDLEKQQKELEEQKKQMEIDALRLSELQKTIDGLKKSDTPFSLVLAMPPADTVSKGLDFTSTLRINPSGLAFTKDMIALDGQYLVTLTTKADEAVWDDSRLAFVGAYVDKEGKNQLVSSEPFNTVMMPSRLVLT